jgi:hypothetical protein
MTDDLKARLNRFIEWLEVKTVVLASLVHRDDRDWEREDEANEDDFEPVGTEDAEEEFKDLGREEMSGA